MVTKRIAISKYGMAYIMSTMRIIRASTLLPRNPAVAPQAMPSDTAASVASKPTVSEMRPPMRQRTNRSRPASSVPQKCAFLNVGAMLMASQSALSNACGNSQGPTTQASEIKASKVKLVTADLLRKNRRHASLHRLRLAIRLSLSLAFNIRSSIANFWIQPGVGQIDQQVQHHRQNGYQHHQTQHQRV